MSHTFDASRVRLCVFINVSDAGHNLLLQVQPQQWLQMNVHDHLKGRHQHCQLHLANRLRQLLQIHLIAGQACQIVVSDCQCTTDIATITTPRCERHVVAQVPKKVLKS